MSGFYSPTLAAHHCEESPAKKETEGVRAESQRSLRRSLPGPQGEGRGGARALVLGDCISSTCIHPPANRTGGASKQAEPSSVSEMKDPHPSRLATCSVTLLCPRLRWEAACLHPWAKAPPGGQEGERRPGVGGVL